MKIKQKTPTNVRNALQHICEANGVHPQMLLCDNGTETNLGEWCQEHR